MDREIAPEIRRRNAVRRGAAAIVGVAAAASVFAASVEWLRPSISRREVQIARVERGVVEATIPAGGTVVPLIEQVVSSPVEARVLRVGRRAGDRVRVGDELLTLDTAATRLETERLADRLSQMESAHAQLRLTLEEGIAGQRAQLEQKKLDAQILRYTAEQKARLRAEGLIAAQEALVAEASAKKADIELRQLQEALARSLRSRAVQLAASEAGVSTARRDREESRRQLELAMLRADRDGILTSIVNEVGATVRRGEIVARIADLSSYRVEATISDVHASRLAAGMRTQVRLDDIVIGGAIESVDPRIVDGVVRFYVTLDQPSHARLRNNLRVDVEVVAGRRRGVLTVRRGTLGRTAANAAFVVRGDNAVRVPVRFGSANERVIEIVDGLREGEEVVISDMAEYQDVDEVKLK